MSAANCEMTSLWLPLVFAAACAVKTIVPGALIQHLQAIRYNKNDIPSKANSGAENLTFHEQIVMADGILDIDVLRDNDHSIFIFTQVLKDVASMEEKIETIGIRSGFITSTSYQEVLLTKTAGQPGSISSMTLSLVLNNRGLFLELKRVNGATWNRISIPASSLSSFTTVVHHLLLTSRKAFGGQPVQVNIAMYIEGMSSFRAQTMDFNMDIYFTEVWDDYRLKTNSTKPILVNSRRLFKGLWTPDLYFANAKKANHHHVTTPNFFMWIFPNGTVYHDSRISLTVNCMMDLSYYPLDTQTCGLRILSYAYDSENLRLEWKNTSAAIATNHRIRFPDMKLLGHYSQSCHVEYNVGDFSGVWSCLEAYFVMNREVMHHVLQSYMPTALIVIISWFSFWLDADAVPGRVSLCITTLLTLTTQSNTARMALPQVSYAKAIDVWMGTCMAFVFGVMIEFTVVNFLSRRARHGEIGWTKTVQFQMKPDEGREVPASKPKLKRSQVKMMVVNIDRSCRVLFPLCFVLFNFVYWPVYMLTSGADEQILPTLAK